MRANRIRTVLSHACIVMALMVAVFFVADRFNPAMEFMTSEMSKWLFLALAVLSFSNAVLTVFALRRAARQQAKRREEARAALKKTGALDAARIPRDGAPQAEETAQSAPQKVDSRKAAG